MVIVKMVMVIMFGLMGMYIEVSGKIIIELVRGHSHGLMGINM
jgi:hypothetical protein